jgi:hypothetical protein
LNLHMNRSGGIYRSELYFILKHLYVYQVVYNYAFLIMMQQLNYGKDAVNLYDKHF